MPTLKRHTIQYLLTKQHFFVVLAMMPQLQRAPLRYRSYATGWFSWRRSKSVVHSKAHPRIATRSSTAQILHVRHRLYHKCITPWLPENNMLVEVRS